jgi:peptide/nickel transport system permease protein
MWNGNRNEFHKKLFSFASFNFGKSLVDGVEVKNKFLTALPWSLILEIPAILFTIVFSIWFAMRRVRFPNSLFMKTIDNGLVWVHSIPGFWLATMLLLLFANPNVFQWFPSGFQSVSSYNPFTIWIYYPQYLLLPLVCLILPALAYLVRMIKNGLEESLQTLFWKRAISTGLSYQQALYKEALPLALIPLIAWCAGILPALISGSLIIEQIFSVPGLGRLMYLSISMRDWPVVQFLFILGAAMTIVGFIISDLLLRFADPRIRQEK